MTPARQFAKKPGFFAPLWMTQKVSKRAVEMISQHPHLPAAMRPAASPVKITGEVRIGTSPPLTSIDIDELPHSLLSPGAGVTPAEEA